MVFDIKFGKLNCIGGYSYIITLPKLWIDSHLLGKGDEVIFTINDDKNLVISPRKKIENEIEGQNNVN